MTKACIVCNLVVRRKFARESEISVLDCNRSTREDLGTPYRFDAVVSVRLTAAENSAAKTTACKDAGGCVPVMTWCQKEEYCFSSEGRWTVVTTG